MRILCLDPGGILGKLPSPVLYPEYGDGFVHLPELGGEYANSVAEFLYSPSQDGHREIWVLWKPGAERYEIERVAKNVLERLGESEALSVYGILLTRVTSGPDKARFFDKHREIFELQAFAEIGNGKSNWHTLLLGYWPGDDQNASADELMLPLSLRCWLDRRQLSDTWREHHYRTLIRFADNEAHASLSRTLVQMRESWQRTFCQLHLHRVQLQSAHCEKRLHCEPQVSWMGFSDRPKRLPSFYCSLVRCLAGVRSHRCISWFFHANDRDTVRNWLDRLFGQLKNAIEACWSAADENYRQELQQFHNNAATNGQGSWVENKTPWQMVEEFERRLNELSAVDTSSSYMSTSLIGEVTSVQRHHMTQLFEAIRCRPTAGLFAVWLVGGLSLLLAVTMFREMLTTVPGAPWVDSVCWPIGSLVMLALAAGWGIVRAQHPTQQGLRNAMAALGSSWQTARLQYEGYTAALTQEIQRVATLRNLEIVRDEMQERDLVLSQIEYHMNRLAEYFRAYGGGELVPQAIESTAPEFNPALPETENPVYRWQGSGVRIDILGIPDSHTASPTSSNARLAGIHQIEIREVAPQGRRLAQS